MNETYSTAQLYIHNSTCPRHLEKPACKRFQWKTAHEV